MEPEHHHSQEHGSGYRDVNGQWVESGTPYHSHHQSPHHQSPVHEYNGFVYNSMSMPPMYAASSLPSMAPPRTAHQQLQPLIMPPWPSMLTSQSAYANPHFALPPIPATPITTPMSAPATTGRMHPTPRKTLTDADRRKMCQYAESHPTVKQNEIGGKWVPYLYKNCANAFSHVWCRTKVCCMMLLL
jgi:hypothetical protein